MGMVFSKYRPDKIERVALVNWCVWGLSKLRRSGLQLVLLTLGQNHRTKATGSATESALFCIHVSVFLCTP